MASLIMPTPPPTQQPAPKNIKPRKDCAYSPAELAILRKYKARYKATTTHAQRETLLRTELLKNIHNYWFEKEGKKPPGDEIKRRTDVRACVIDVFRNSHCLRKALIYWIRNNWRPTNRIETNRSKKKKSRIQIVWRERRDEVEAEMETLYEREGGTAAMDNRTKLRLRPTAARNVYLGLDDEEKADIDRAIAKIAAEGNPPDIQRKRAVKHGATKIQQLSEERWKDMGILMVTFYAYRGTDSKVAIGV